MLPMTESVFLDTFDVIMIIESRLIAKVRAVIYLRIIEKGGRCIWQRPYICPVG